MASKNKKNNNNKKPKLSLWIFIIVLVLIVLAMDIFFIVNYTGTKSEENFSELENNLSETREIAKLNESLIESNIIDLVNEKRGGRFRREFNENGKLHQLAKNHSTKMLEENFFRESIFPQGQNIGQTQINKQTENCGSVFTEEEVAFCIVDSWKNNTIYNENMIASRYFRTGVGVACDETICKVTEYFN